MLNTPLVYSSALASFQRLPNAAPAETAKPAAASEVERQPADPAAGEKLSPSAAQALVKDMNQALQSINTGLEFSLDKDTGQTVIKLIDRETKETLRQIPSEEAISIARSLDRLKGALIRQSA